VDRASARAEGGIGLVSWWGKLIGGAVGFLAGGPLAALLGAVLGHQLDRGLQLAGGVDEASDAADLHERIQSAFFTATFAVMGHIAKADGRVSPNEIALAEMIMENLDLSPELRRAAIGLFREGKRSEFALDPVLDQLRAECGRRQTVLRMFLEIQIQAAFADGGMDRVEEELLLHICRRLGIPERTFRQLAALIRAEREAHARQREAAGGEAAALSLADAYAILGVLPQAGDDEVKRAYRRLLSQHHPDKLVSKGLPEQMMRLANQKTLEIRAAYERVCVARGIT
jgi:DnaJ like chaperone protein